MPERQSVHPSHCFLVVLIYSFRLLCPLSPCGHQCSCIYQRDGPWEWLTSCGTLKGLERDNRPGIDICSCLFFHLTPPPFLFGPLLWCPSFDTQMGLESGGQKVTSCCGCVSGGRRSLIPCTHGFLWWLNGVWVSVCLHICVCVCWTTQAQDAIWPLTSGRRLRRRLPQWQPVDKQRGLKRFPFHSLSTFVSVSLSLSRFFCLSCQNRHLQHDQWVSSSGCKHSPFFRKPPTLQTLFIRCHVFCETPHPQTSRKVETTASTF